MIHTRVARTNSLTPNDVLSKNNAPQTILSGLAVSGQFSNQSRRRVTEQEYISSLDRK